jgi:dihydroorotate dehydrogenase (fumarate)
MTDLTTTYLGLELKNPLVASASPLSKKIENAQKLETAGVGAIVMYSLFEEQIIHDSLELDHYLTRGTNSFAEAQTYLPDIGVYHMGPDKYLDHLAAIKAAVKIPVIASLNGVSKGGWTRYAHFMQEAGADAVELNMYYLSGDPDLTGGEMEDNYVELVGEVKNSISIPLAVKLSPFITALPNFARRLSDAGADGLVLFNRFYPGAESFQRFAPAVAMDFHPAWKGRGRLCAHQRDTHGRRRSQGHDGRRQGRHVRLDDPA